MFSPNSRYANAGTDTVPGAHGAGVTVCRIPIRPRTAIRGFHRCSEGQRLDGIAAHYLFDATGFWRLCDAAGAVVPDALAARELVPIPARER
jgi:hypothetical protein